MPTVFEAFSNIIQQIHPFDQDALTGILSNLFWAALCIVAFIIVTAILRRGVRRLILFVARSINRNIKSIQFRGVWILRPHYVVSVITGLIKILHFLFYLAVVYSVLQYGLKQAPEELQAIVTPISHGILSSILLLFIAWIVFSGLHSAFHFIERHIEKTLSAQLRPFRWRNMELFSISQLQSLVRNLFLATRALIYVSIGYLFLVLLFSFFSFSSDWAGQILAYALRPLRSMAVGFIEYLPNLFFIIVTVFVVRYTLRFVRMFFQGLSSKRNVIQGFYPEWADTTYKIVVFFLLAFSAVLIFPYLPGSNSEAFKGVGLFLGFMFSLGSTAIIANIVAGVVLTYMRPFQIGDKVKIADTVGQVMERSLLVTRIRNAHNIEITVPNGLVLGAHILNYSAIAKTSGIMLSATVHVGYDIAPATVESILLEAAKRTEHLTVNPSPFVLQTELNQAACSYELNGFTMSVEQMETTHSKMHRNIMECFTEAGLSMLLPQYQVKMDQPPTKPTVRKPLKLKPTQSAASTPTTKKRVSPTQNKRKKRSS